MRILNSSGWKLRVVIRLEWVLLLNTPSSPPEALHWNTGVYRFQYHSRHLSAEMLSSTLFSSVPQSCLTLCDPMECSTPGFPVHHQLLELAQTHVHWVGDAIQPSHPLSSPSPHTFSLSQHQGLFKWDNSLHSVAQVWSFTFNISPSNEYSGLILALRTPWTV